jgi:DNA-binding transcriptional regulator YiaG
MGMIAWNIHVTGRQELADCAFAGSKLNAEQQKMVQDEIAGLVQRKIELYPRQMTAIRDVAATLINGSPKAKARPGDACPELPAKNVSEPEESITAEDIAALRKEMKLTQAKFGELFGVTARKVSEWEHGKSLPDASLQNKISDLQKGIGNG